MEKQKIDYIIAGFYDHTLPKSEWTHQAHLIVGLHAIISHGLEESEAIVRNGIKGYNLAVGTPNTDTGGYHETITMFYLHALAAFVRRNNANNDIYTLVAKLAKSKLMDQALLFDFYARDKLFSVEARRNWVAPTERSIQTIDEVV